MPKISVIIPIYNAQDSLAHCLDSLLAQTLADFELLLINDGSQDDSAKICEDYAVRDGRIKVFHQENGGVSRARQKGLEQATGDYLIHVDADDWVSPQYLQLLYEEALRSGADIVLCDYEQVYANKRVRCSAAPTSDKPEDFVFDLCTRLHGSCSNKLVRRAIIEEHKISFPEGIYLMEDKLFMLKCACVGRGVSYVSEPLYYYDCRNLEYRVPQAKLLQRIQYELNVFVFQYLSKISEHPKIAKGLRAFYLTMAAGIVVHGDWDDPYLDELGRKGDFVLAFSLRNLSLYSKLLVLAKIVRQKWIREILLQLKRNL